MKWISHIIIFLLAYTLLFEYAIFTPTKQTKKFEFSTKL